MPGHWLCLQSRLVTTIYLFERWASYRNGPHDPRSRPSVWGCHTKEDQTTSNPIVWLPWGRWDQSTNKNQSLRRMCVDEDRQQCLAILKPLQHTWAVLVPFAQTSWSFDLPDELKSPKRILHLQVIQKSRCDKLIKSRGCIDRSSD